MNYKISEEFANKILAYLGTRPYAEVVNLITGFNTLEKIQVKESPAVDKKK